MVCCKRRETEELSGCIGLRNGEFLSKIGRELIAAVSRFDVFAGSSAEVHKISTGSICGGILSGADYEIKAGSPVRMLPSHLAKRHSWFISKEFHVF